MPRLPSPPSPRHSFAGGPGRLSSSLLRVGAALGLVLSGGIANPAIAGGAPRDLPSDVQSIAYQDALVHASDTNAFTPGDAVTVGFRPRTGSTYLVDDQPPVALPAGRASGRSMAASPQGSVDAVADVPPPVDPASASATGGQAEPSGNLNVLRREIFGFLPYWESSYTPNYDITSSIAYFGVGIGSTGDLIKKDSDGSTSTGWSGWTSSWMTRIINAAHANGTRVEITIQAFAWSTAGAQTQTTLLSSATNRANGIAQIVAAIKDRGADGVNLDFEPIASGQAANFTLFVRDLRTALNTAHPGYELTYDATGRGSTYDNVGLLSSGHADAVFIMGYDFRDIHSTYAASHDPLTSPKVFDLTDSVKRFKGWGPDSKIILGLPYYGRQYKVNSLLPYATTTASATNVTFSEGEADLAQHGRSYDSIEQSAWTSWSVTGGYREIYFDDATALAAREDMINYWNLRGMGIWVLGYDAGTSAASTVLAARFLTDKTPPKVGIVNMSPLQTDEGFAVDWRGYDVQVSKDDGAFTAWLTGATATSSNYQGTTGHNYSFRVRATDGAGNVGPWDVASIYTASPAFKDGAYAQVAAPVLHQRGSPTTSAGVIDGRDLTTGQVVQILDGPVSADGYTWYQITSPFAEINAVLPLFPGAWVAASDATSAYLTPITPPNSTAVAAGISDFHVGVSGLQPSGTGIDRGKVFSPDGDGIHDTMPLSWTNNTPLNSVTLNVFKSNGASAGAIALGVQDAGPQTFTWTGLVDGATAPVPDGEYLIQVVGADASASYHAPSGAPFVAAQWASFGIYVDTAKTGTYFSVRPVRVLDTRYGIGGPVGPLTVGKARRFVVAGKSGIPANAIGVTGNLTVTGATATGFVQIGATTTGVTSTINLKKGDNRANGVTLGLAPDGSLSLLLGSSTASASVHAVFDLTGYFLDDPSGATFIPVAPTRLVDTRAKKGISGPLVSGKISSFQVAGIGPIPATAIAVTGNATVSASTGHGYVTLAPTIPTGTAPTTSTLNFPRGDIRANNVVVPLSKGKLQVEYVGQAKTSTQFIFDVTGYFVPGLSGATFVPVGPGRVVDSRASQGFKGPLKNGSAASFPVGGRAAINVVALAVVGNLTVTGQNSSGWLSIGPAMTTTSSTLNFTTGDNRANGFVSLFGGGGTLTVTYGGGKSGSVVQAVVDVLGYYR